MDLNDILKTETPTEALRKIGVNLPDMTQRGLIFSCNVWHCETCGKNNAYEIPINVSMSFEEDKKTKVTKIEQHYFCTNECEAVWIVKTTHMALSFKERLWNITGEKLLHVFGTGSQKIIEWWQWNISKTAPEIVEIFRGRKELTDLLQKGSEKTIDKFYLRYLDATVLGQKLAEKFPDGLLMVSLTEKAPSPGDPYSIGARFLVKWPDILFFSDTARKSMRIEPHPRLKIKRKLELIGSEIPGSIDWMPLIELPDKNPGLEIHIPMDKKIIVHIGIKKYIDFIDNKFVAIGNIYDKKYLRKDSNGNFYLPYRLEFEWHPDKSSKDSFEKQFMDFVSAARDFSELHGIREFNELLTNGNFSQETLADIGLFIEDWRQWKEKHTMHNSTKIEI